MEGLRPRRIKATRSKKVDPLVTPEAENFRKETSKLTNWTQHRRITDYLEGGPPEEQDADPDAEPEKVNGEA